MANQRKRLGTALESTVAKLANEAGIAAKKQPLSGVLTDYPNDVAMDVDGVLAECKVRSVYRDSRGARMLPFDLEWLDKVLKNAKRENFKFGIVVTRPKNSPRLLVTMELENFLEILTNGHKNGVQTLDSDPSHQYN